MRDNNADRRLDAMSAGADAIQMRKRGDHTDGPMTAHPEVRDVVEEDHAGYARLINRRAQQRSDNSIRATRFVHHSATKVVVFFSEAFDTIRKCVVTEIGTSADNHTCGLTASVRVDYFDFSQSRH